MARNLTEENAKHAGAGKWILRALGAFVALALFTSTLYTIETGTVGVISTFGEYDTNERTAGIHIKIPGMQTLRVVDTKVQTVNYIGQQDLPDRDGVCNKPLIRVLDAKSLPVGIEITVQYRLLPTEAAETLGLYGKNYFEKIINPTIRDIIRDVIGQYNAETLALDRTSMNTKMVSMLRRVFQEVKYFDLVAVNLRDINLPPVVNQKIEEVQRAKQEEQRLQMVEKQVVAEQRIKTTKANTKLIEVTTQAKAEAEQRRIAADAKAYQIEKEAQAQAKANKVVAESLTPELTRYLYVRAWNGRMPETVVGSQSDGLMLNLKK